MSGRASARSRGRPPGRRPGDPEQTKQAILDAARATFGAKGFDRATIRAIAAAADVDPALVMHHFGSKRGLFVAAHQLPVDPAVVFPTIADLPPSERGEAAARTFLGLFANPGSPMVSMLRAAASEPAAATMYREFIEHTVIRHGLTILEDPERDGRLRMTLLAGQLLGIAVTRQIIQVGPVADATIDEIVAAVTPTIQAYIDGPAGGG